MSCIDKMLSDDLGRCGGLSPVAATDDMTQPVGQRDGQLYTKPVAAAEGLTDIEDTEEIVAEIEDGVASLTLAQPVSNKLARALLTPTFAPAAQQVVTVDTNGAQRMEDYKKINPVFKTNEMTQSVGVDYAGRLFTQPGGGGGGGGAVDSVNGYTGTVVLTADDLQTDASETVQQELHDIWDVLEEIPGEYIKRASVSGNTLTLTKQNEDTVTFTPSGGGGHLYRHLIYIAFNNEAEAAGEVNFTILNTSPTPITTFSGLCSALLDYVGDVPLDSMQISTNDNAYLFHSIGAAEVDELIVNELYVEESSFSSSYAALAAGFVSTVNDNVMTIF